MTATTTAPVAASIKVTPKLAALLAEGRVAYVPGGLDKYASEQRTKACATYRILAVRDAVWHYAGVYGIERDQSPALIVERIADQPGDYSRDGALEVLTRPDWATGAKGWDKTGELCIPLKRLGLHFASAAACEAQREKNVACKAELDRAVTARKKREAGLQYQLAAALGVTADHSLTVSRGEVTLSGKALEALLAALNIQPEA